MSPIKGIIAGPLAVKVGEPPTGFVYQKVGRRKVPIISTPAGNRHIDFSGGNERKLIGQGWYIPVILRLDRSDLKRFANKAARAGKTGTGKLRAVRDA